MLTDTTALFADLLRQVPFGVAVFDREFRFLYVNDMMAAINGVPAADHVGRLVWDIVPDPAIRARAEHVLQHVLETGEPCLDVDLVGETRAMSGEVRAWVEDFYPLRNAEGRVTAVAGVAREVTEERRSAAALKESQERLRLALATTKMGTWEHDLEKDVIHADLWARRLYRVRGKGPFTVADVVRHIHPDDLEGVIQARNRALDPGTAAPYKVEYRVVSENKSPRWVQVQGAAFFTLEGANRKAVRLIGTVRNVTQRKEDEERRALLLAELDHRVKNILGTIGALVDRSLEVERAPADLRAALRGRVQAMALVHQLLSRTRWQGVDLHFLLNELLAAFLERPDARVNVDGVSAVLKPQAAQSIAMALHELATNAVKYGALVTDAGRVRVTWKANADGSLRIVWREEKGPPVEQTRGTGFGMHLLTRTLAHDPCVHVNLQMAREGVHCTFTVKGDAWKPMKAVRRHPRKQAKAGHEGAGLARLRVLIAEDDPLIAEALAAFMKDANLHVQDVAATLSDGLARLEQSRPDVALLDINLQGERVYPLADRLHEQGVPFLFTTGYEADLVVPERFRHVPFASKPYDPDRIIAMLKALRAEAPRDEGRGRNGTRPPTAEKPKATRRSVSPAVGES